MLKLPISRENGKINRKFWENKIKFSKIFLKISIFNLLVV